MRRKQVQEAEYAALVHHALGFIHEYITKEVALQLGMVVEPAESKDQQLFMPKEHECSFCFINLEHDPSAHDFICKHPLLTDIKEMARTGRKTAKVLTILRSADTRSQLVPVAKAPVQRKKLVDKDTVRKEANAARAPRKKKRVSEESESV